MTISKGRLTASVGIVTAIAFLSAACTSTDSSSGSGSTTSSVDDSTLAAITDVVKKASAEQSTWPGPDESIEPAKGKKIVAITCGSQGYGCVQGAQGVKDAGETLDWNVTVVDGKGDPSVWNSSVTQAVSDGADGIVLAAINPALVSDGLARAKTAGIPVIVEFLPETKGVDISGWVSTDHSEGGKILADWAIADSRGAAHALVLEEPAFPELVKRNKGILDELDASCPKCKVAKPVEFSIGTMAQQLAGQVTTNLQSNPDIDYVFAPFDSAATFAAQGIRQSGRTDVKLISGEGDPDGIARVRNGGQAVDLATVPAWAGWAAVDQLARLFDGQAVEPYNLPQRLITSDNAPTEAGGWPGDVDYTAKFTELWGK